MKKNPLNILLFFLLISLIGCAQSGSSNLSKDNIVGCWEGIEVSHIIESNFAAFDEHAQEQQKKDMAERFKEAYITKYTNNKVYSFTKHTGELRKDPSDYYIKGDSLYSTSVGAGGYRVHHYVNKTQIINDTMYTELDVYIEIKRIYVYADVRKTLIFPEDFKIKKAVRLVKSVRVKDCDRYKID